MCFRFASQAEHNLGTGFLFHPYTLYREIEQASANSISLIGIISLGKVRDPVIKPQFSSYPSTGISEILWDPRVNCPAKNRTDAGQEFPARG